MLCAVSLYENMMILIWQYDDHHMTILWWWHVARIMTLQKIHGLYGLKHHIVAISGDHGYGTNERRTREDRATQLSFGVWMLEGWVSQFVSVLSVAGPHRRDCGGIEVMNNILSTLYLPVTVIEENNFLCQGAKKISWYFAKHPSDPPPFFLKY